MNDPIEQSLRSLMHEFKNWEYNAKRGVRRIETLLGDVAERKKVEEIARTDMVWMNKTQAGKYLGVTPRTILRYEKDGKLGFNGSGRIHRSELDSFMRDHKSNRAKLLGLINGRSE